MKTKEPFKAGYVSVAGFPNVGKSTLLNRVVGSKLAIVSPKPQTTRTTIKGFLSTDKAQIIFCDTAGIHKPKDKLGHYMVDAATKSFHAADIIYIMVDGIPPRPKEIDLIGLVKAAKKTTFLIINKVDLIKKASILPLIDHYSRVMEFDEIIPLSALEGDNVDKLLELTIAQLPESAPLFPDDILSDQIERVFISEFIREKIFMNTKDEIPYSTAVVIDDMKERKPSGAYIIASIFLEKDSQKGILIGKGGRMIKKIGQEARREIEKFLGYSIYLDLKVKVEKKWRGKAGSLRKLGYY